MARTITIDDEDSAVTTTIVLGPDADDGPIVWSVNLTAGDDDRGVLPEDLLVLERFGLRLPPRTARTGGRLRRIDIGEPVDNSRLRPVDNPDGETGRTDPNDAPPEPAE